MRTVEVADELGVSYRQLDHWVRRGYVGVGMTGSGHFRHWTASDVRIARFIATLTHLGIVRPGWNCPWLEGAIHTLRKHKGPGFVTIAESGKTDFRKADAMTAKDSCVLVRVEA